MKKMVYVAWCSKHSGDDYIEGISFDLEECRRAAVSDREHLTAREREKSYHFIKGYTIDVLDGQIARVAYEEWGLEQCCMPDSEYYEDVYIDDDYGVRVKTFNSNYHVWITRGDEAIFSHMVSTDGFEYVEDQQSCDEYIAEGNVDDGTVILVPDAVEADMALIRDTLAEGRIYVPEKIFETLNEDILSVYLDKAV